MPHDTDDGTNEEGEDDTPRTYCDYQLSKTPRASKPEENDAPMDPARKVREAAGTGSGFEDLGAGGDVEKSAQETLEDALDDWDPTGTVVDGEDVDAYGGVREYHREGFRALSRLAEMEPDALRGLADDLANGLRQDEGHPLAGLALPFATQSRFTTTSNSLTT